MLIHIKYDDTYSIIGNHFYEKVKNTFTYLVLYYLKIPVFLTCQRSKQRKQQKINILLLNKHQTKKMLQQVNSCQSFEKKLNF